MIGGPLAAAGALWCGVVWDGVLALLRGGLRLPVPHPERDGALQPLCGRPAGSGLDGRLPCELVCLQELGLLSAFATQNSYF